MNQQHQIHMGRGSYAHNYNVTYMLTISFLEVELYCCCVISSSEYHFFSCSMHAVRIVSCLHGDIPVAVCALESDIDVSVHLRLLKCGISGSFSIWMSFFCVVPMNNIAQTSQCLNRTEIYSWHSESTLSGRCQVTHNVMASSRQYLTTGYAVWHTISNKEFLILYPNNKVPARVWDAWGTF